MNFIFLLETSQCIDKYPFQAPSDNFSFITAAGFPSYNNYQMMKTLLVSFTVLLLCSCAKVKEDPRQIIKKAIQWPFYQCVSDKPLFDTRLVYISQAPSIPTDKPSNTIKVVGITIYKKPFCSHDLVVKEYYNGELIKNEQMRRIDNCRKQGETVARYWEFEVTKDARKGNYKVELTVLAEEHKEQAGCFGFEYQLK